MSIKFPYRYRLLLSLFPFFLAFALLIIGVAFRREKKLKRDVINTKLESFDAILSPQLKRADTLLQAKAPEIIHALPKGIRFSIIKSDGELVFDNTLTSEQMGDDHSNRPEVLKAKKEGRGTDIRVSKSNQKPYIYYAKLYPKGYVVRFSLPYDDELKDFLSFDNYLIYSLVALLFITLFLFHLIIGKLVRPIRKVLSLTQEKDESLSSQDMDFEDNEIGVIAKNILTNYRRLEQSQRQVDIEREQSIKLKQEMTGNIAHELRTPVTSIRAYLETLETNNSLSKEEQDKFIQKAHDQSIRLSNLIQDISILHKVEQGEEKSSFEVFNLRGVLDNVFDDLNEPLTRQQIDLDVQLANKLPFFGNKNLIYSVFRNLTENVIAYSGEGARIIIKLYKEDKQFYHISFADTGVGISPEALPRIFERFYRIDKGRTRSMGNSGLGLAIVKNVIMLHDGSITAQNRVGGGLELLISLPKHKILDLVIKS